MYGHCKLMSFAVIVLTSFTYIVFGEKSENKMIQLLQYVHHHIITKAE